MGKTSVTEAFFDVNIKIGAVRSASDLDLFYATGKTLYQLDRAQGQLESFDSGESVYRLKDGRFIEWDN